MISRRNFLAQGLGLAGVAGLGSVLCSCEPQRKVGGVLSGPNATMGHMLRNPQAGHPTESYKKDVVIIGGGIAGLSAARYLNQFGVDFLMMEMEQNVGGNSSSASNTVSSYPLGAHYLTLPASNDGELIRFLEECNVITGKENGQLVFNEYYLCFDPKERLYINGHWQEGLLPMQGVPSGEISEIRRFHDLIENYKGAKGADGKEAFCIPLAFCSNDPAFLQLDKISFGQFLKEKGFQSPHLLWYLNYCCSDDYGATIQNTSAWAGIHYFASHKVKGANAPSDSVLTWPEGNGWLVKQLEQSSNDKTLTNVLVQSVTIKADVVLVDYFDATSGVTKRVEAKKVIVATPQFINQRILSPSLERDIDYKSFIYAPWMVANLTVAGDLSERRGETLSWDNVIYGSKSLGYVDATHQRTEAIVSKKVLTYYLPLTGDDCGAERRLAHSRTYQDWNSLILQDLKKPHPGIEQHLEAIDVWIWGHGMIRPSVNFIHNPNLLKAQADLENMIFFAHSDLSGISIFEEAFFHGTQAAKKVLL
jgi:predicted NAD/FAD-binding protein